ncbi:MAG: FAD-dependent oxidoreductase [Dinoroseobacter sp.]|nr:FAD-dependent oxidoreductase [Dinoroseobacter sp.]
MTRSIAVLGAGVAGLCVATELSDRGLDVSIHDPAGEPGAHGCSWWAGGMLAPYCEYENAEPPVLINGQMALAWWSQKTEVAHKGTLVVAQPRDRGDVARFAARTEGYETVDSARIQDLEPDLGRRFPAGLFFAGEGHLDPRRALTDLVARLRAQGVEIQTLPPAPERQIVDCRGLAAQDRLANLRGVRGEMALIRSRDVTFTRPIRLLHARIPLYVVPRGDGVYMLGATMIESSARGPMTVRSALELLSAAYALNPAFGEAEILEFGTDLRPAFPDNLPRVVEKDGVLYVNGLYRHGYLMAPALAQQVAERITGQMEALNATAD